jgi:hypothetical protein
MYARHLAPLLVFTASFATASNLQVNYYTDGGCSDFRTNIFPFTDE